MTLPINTWLSNACLIIFFVLVILNLIRAKPQVSTIKNKRKLLYSVLPLFFLLFFGLLGSANLDDSFRFFEKSISLLLSPLIFIFFTQNQLKMAKSTLLKGLFIGSTVSMLYLLVMVFYHYFDNQEGFAIHADLFNYYHTHYNFTNALGMHPTYLGIYYLTCLFFLREITNKKPIRLLWLGLLLFTLLFINSRVIFLILFLYGLLSYGQYLKKALVAKKSKIIVFSALAILIGGAVLSVMLSKTYIAHRLMNLYQFELSGNKEQSINQQNIGNPRWIRWQSALTLIKEKPLLGHGTADEYIMLNEQFKKDGLKYVVDSNYNAHNQFLGYGIRFGILGIIVLFHFFVQNIRRAIILKDMAVFMSFVAIFLICLFENYFDRNFGITFSAIFLTIFTYMMFEANPIQKETLDG